MVNYILTILCIIFASSVVILIYCYVLAKLKHRINIMRNWMIFIALIGGFVIYFIGFSMNSENGNSTAVNAILAIHANIEVLFMQSNLDKIAPQLKDNKVYMLFFVAINALGMLLIITTAISIFGRRLNAKLQLLPCCNKKCYMFFDTNEEALVLGKNLLEKDPKRLVIFVGSKASEKDMSMFDEIEKFGAYYIENNQSKNKIGGNLLFRYIIKHNSKLFFISNDEDKNVSGALNLFSLLKSLSPDKIQLAEQNINIYVRIVSEDIHQVFEEARRIQSINFNYSVFSDAEIVANQAINRCNLVDYVKIDTSKAIATENLEIMIIGFGDKGNAILRKLIECGQFIGSTFSATIIDRDLNSKMGSFDTTYPGISDNYKIETFEDSVGSHTFFSLLKERSKTLKQIVISLGNDSQNIKIAIEIEKMLSSLNISHIDIFAITRKNDSYSYIDKSEDFASIKCIGQNKDIFTEDIIINESLYAQAVATHNFYKQRKSPEKRVEWKNLQNIKKQSNISASNHIKTKLALMGLTIEAVKKMQNYDEFLEYVKKDAERYENLAKIEHLRWNASYFVRGWHKWNLEDIEGDANQDHRHKLHACLVSWDELDAVSKRFNDEPYKQYDFDNIDALYELITNDLVNKGEF